MIMKLNVIDSFGNTFAIYFDHHTFKFYYDEAMTILLPFPDERFSSENVKKPKLIVIPLGYQCPNKCVYCIQRRFKNSNLNMTKLKQTLNAVIAKNSIERIHFIGGEPLLQWNVIEEIVNTFPTLEYSLITNGIHIDQEIAEFIVKHKISITVSHDGESQRIQRGINIFDSDNPVSRLIAYISNHVPLKVVSVLCNDGTRTLERWKYFKNLEAHIQSVDVKPIIPYKESQIDLMVGRDDWDAYLAELIEDIGRIYQSIARNDKRHKEEAEKRKQKRQEMMEKGELEISSECIINTEDTIKELPYNGLQADNEIFNYMRTLDANLNTQYNKEETKCPIFNPEIITINQNGNFQYCYNCDTPITEKVTNKLKRYDRMETCEKCPMVLTCTGTCRLLKETCAIEACHRSFYRNMAYFFHYVYQTYGYVITSIEGDFSHATNRVYDIKFDYVRPTE